MERFTNIFAKFSSCKYKYVYSINQNILTSSVLPHKVGHSFTVHWEIFTSVKFSRVLDLYEFSRNKHSDEYLFRTLYLAKIGHSKERTGILVLIKFAQISQIENILKIST